MQHDKPRDEQRSLARKRQWFINLDDGIGAAAGLSSEVREALVSATVDIAAEQTTAELRTQAEVRRAREQEQEEVRRAREREREVAERVRRQTELAEREHRRAVTGSRLRRLLLFFGYIGVGLALMQGCQTAFMTSDGSMDGFTVLICWLIVFVGPWPFAFGASALAGRLWQLEVGAWFIGIAAFFLQGGIFLWRILALL